MPLLARIPWLHRQAKIADDAIRDVSEILAQGKSTRRSENLRFTIKTRGKSPTHLFGREQLREAIIHCVMPDDKKK